MPACTLLNDSPHFPTFEVSLGPFLEQKAFWRYNLYTVKFSALKHTIPSLSVELHVNIFIAISLIWPLAVTDLISELF